MNLKFNCSFTPGETRSGESALPRRLSEEKDWNMRLQREGKKKGCNYKNQLQVATSARKPTTRLKRTDHTKSFRHRGSIISIFSTKKNSMSNVQLQLKIEFAWDLTGATYSAKRYPDLWGGDSEMSCKDELVRRNLWIDLKDFLGASYRALMKRSPWRAR